MCCSCLETGLSFPMTARSGAKGLLGALGVAASLLAPPEAYAADRLVLTPHVDVAQVYIDNVFYDSESEKNDSITRITPSLTLAGYSETGASRLVVGATVREYWRYSELDAIDPFVRAKFTRELTPRWSVAGNAEYRLRHSTDAVSGGDEGDLYGARPELETTTLGGQVGRRLSPSTTIFAHASYLDVDHPHVAVQRDRTLALHLADHEYELRVDLPDDDRDVRRLDVLGELLGYLLLQLHRRHALHVDLVDERYRDASVGADHDLDQAQLRLSPDRDRQYVARADPVVTLVARSVAIEFGGRRECPLGRSAGAQQQGGGRYC